MKLLDLFDYKKVEKYVIGKLIHENEEWMICKFPIDFEKNKLRTYKKFIGRDENGKGIWDEIGILIGCENEHYSEIMKLIDKEVNQS